MVTPQVCNMTANTVTLVVVCKMHGKGQTTVVDREAYRKWLMREGHAQDLFPSLTPSKRGLFFITGVCGDCYDELFAED